MWLLEKKETPMGGGRDGIRSLPSYHEVSPFPFQHSYMHPRIENDFNKIKHNQSAIGRDHSDSKIHIGRGEKEELVSKTTSLHIKEARKIEHSWSIQSFSCLFGTKTHKGNKCLFNPS